MLAYLLFVSYYFPGFLLLLTRTTTKRYRPSAARWLVETAQFTLEQLFRQVQSRSRSCLKSNGRDGGVGGTRPSQSKPWEANRALSGAELRGDKVFPFCIGSRRAAAVAAAAVPGSLAGCWSVPACTLPKCLFSVLSGFMRHHPLCYNLLFFFRLSKTRKGFPRDRMPVKRFKPTKAGFSWKGVNKSVVRVSIVKLT